MICKNCGEPVVVLDAHAAFEPPHYMRYFCSPKADRSEALPGCPPSATGSAGARASDEAGADSSGRSADAAVRRDLSPSEAEIASKLNDVLDQLRWFYDRGIKLEISPAETGWSLKLTMADTSADAHSGA